jgi:hypothetical protein
MEGKIVNFSIFNLTLVDFSPFEVTETLATPFPSAFKIIIAFS